MGNRQKRDKESRRTCDISGLRPTASANMGLPETPVADKAAGRQQVQARAVRGDHADERYSGRTSGGRSRRTAFSADARSSQAGSSLWRAVPHHRHHTFQLHQLRSAPGVHPDAVQGSVAEPAHPRRVDQRCGAGAGRVHRDSAADAAGERELVHGHGGRGLPEHLFDWIGAAEARADPFRRSHIQNALRQDAAAASGFGRRCDAGNAADRAAGGCTVRHCRSGAQWRSGWIPREAEEDGAALAFQSEHGGRFDGRLPVQHRRTAAGADQGCRRS